MPSSRPAVRFQDILDNVQLIQSYLKGMDQAAFATDRRTRDAEYDQVDPVRIWEIVSRDLPLIETAALGRLHE